MSEIARAASSGTMPNAVLWGVMPVTAPVRGKEIPIVYEDEGQGDMGESDVHTQSVGVLYYGLQAHHSGRTNYRAFSNLNLHYSDDDAKAFVSPDIMVVE